MMRFVITVLLAASLAAPPVAVIAAPPPGVAPDGRSCAVIEAMITERVQEMGVEFSRRFSSISYALAMRGHSPLTPPRQLTTDELYRLTQRVRDRPGARILSLQVRIEADLAALARAGCPDYGLPTDMETYEGAATVCDSARLEDETDALDRAAGRRPAARDPEYVTALACDRAQWKPESPMSEPGLIYDPAPVFMGPADPPPISSGPGSR